MSFTNNAGVAVSGRTTANRDLVVLPSLYKWAAQGKIFHGGHGLQTDGDDSQAETTLTPDDVKATWALQAPGGSKIIVPLLFKCMWEVEGGAATDAELIFTKAASKCATHLTLSGRAMAAGPMPTYSADPITGSATASLLYGVATTFLLTVSALTDADMVMADYRALVDNNLKSPVVGSSQQLEINFATLGAPIMLQDGAAMIFYINSGTSDAVIHPYFQWAELDLGDLV